MKKVFLLFSIICITAPAQAFLGEKVRRVEPKAACSIYKVRSKEYGSASDRFYGMGLEMIEAKTQVALKLRATMTFEEYEEWLERYYDENKYSANVEKIEPTSKKSVYYKYLPEELINRHQRRLRAKDYALNAYHEALMPIHIHLGYTDAEIIEMRSWSTGGVKRKKWMKYFWGLSDEQRSSGEYISSKGRWLKTGEANEFCKSLGIEIK